MKKEMWLLFWGLVMVTINVDRSWLFRMESTVDRIFYGIMGYLILGLGCFLISLYFDKSHQKKKDSKNEHSKQGKIKR